ncbi:hypothetical protein DFP73DRAFT_553376 [Morchella snyderi]|nr:hypothetical protein DFP73DRAFT_553376 [Morchella snyderi]
MQDELWEMEKSESSLVVELETAKDQVRGIEERERTSTKKFEEDIRKINRESQEKEGKLRKMQNDLREREKSASIQVAELMIAKNQARKKEEGEGASVKNYQGDIRKIQRESKEREDKLERRLDIAEKSEKTLREELKVAREKIGGMELREKKLKAAMGSVADQGDALGLETRREEVSQRGSTNDEGIMIHLLGTIFDKMELEQ